MLFLEKGGLVMSEWKKVNAGLLKMAKCFVNHFFRVLYYRKPGFFSHRFYNVNLPQDMSVALLKTCIFFLAYMPPWVKTWYPNSHLLLKKQLQGIFFMNLIHFIEILKCYRIRKNSKRSWRIVLILVGFSLKWKLRTSLPQH